MVSEEPQDSDCQFVAHGGDCVHRIPAEQTATAIARPDGLYCHSFHQGDGMAYGSLVWYSSSGWRRVSPTRFEPLDPDPEWNVFVDWRREDGRWVVSAIGQEGEHVPRVLGTSVEEARDTLRGRPLRLPMPADARYATATRWYPAGEPLRLDGPPMLRYGSPRKLEDGSLVYFTTYDGVALYTEPRELRSSWGPTVVYAPLDPSGLFQAYVGWRGNGCN